LACFCEAAQARLYKKGKILYIEEEPAEFCYVINGGWIKLFHTTPEGEEVVVDILTRGHMVGESAVFEKGFYTSSAQVVEDAHVLSLPTKILKDEITANPSLALSMLSAMYGHHRRHYDTIALNAMQSAPQRIGCFLLGLCPLKSTETTFFELPYDKTLIADILGMKGATFSRALNVLRLKTSLKIVGTRVDIASVSELMTYVYGVSAGKYPLR